MRGTLALFGLLAVLATPVVTLGAPAKAPAKAAKAEPEPTLPPPQVTLTVTPGKSGALWRMQIENTGEGPVRIPADPRLLILELTPTASSDAPTRKGQEPKKPAAPTPVRCILPDDARPSTDEGRELVIPTKRAWSSSFDPLFYCFGARERAALIAGSTVTARFGWPTTRAGTPAPPLAVTPVGASVGKVAALKAIEATPFTLSEAVSVGNASEKSETSDSTSNGVTLSAPETMDAARGAELATTVTLTNGSDRPITLLYRPEMLQFNVSTRSGTVSCGYPRTVASPIRELFITVPVKGKVSTSVLFTTTCPPDTFEEPGIYRVSPRLDTTRATGTSIGMKTWDGLAVAKTPLLLRVRSPRKAAPITRPTLD